MTEAEQTALATLRELIDAGLAGLDDVDADIFAVDASRDRRDQADVALDTLGASFYRDGAFHTHPRVLLCRLPHWVRLELELDAPGAPRLELPLFSL